MNLHPKLDETDLRILSLLMKNAKMPYTEVASRVFVSGGTVHLRMKKMEDLGIVQGSSLSVDISKLGFDVTAYLGIYLTTSSLYDDVADKLAEIPEILSLHYTTGAYSIFIQLICRDTKHLREILHDKIQPIEGIARTETLISLEERFRRPLVLNEDMIERT
ncbi:MAG: Lrp/AsnC ligand binding domain-containing protein [Bacteroidota bacterium]